MKQSAPPKPSAEPLILTMDTAGTACQAVLSRGAAVLAHETHSMMRGHGEALVPMVERILATGGHSYDDLDRLGVTVGPGSFTGLRVGLAAARGFSATLNIDVVGVGSLEALAVSDRLASGTDGPRAVALDARNGLVYGQLFDRDGVALTQPDVMADLVFAASVREGMRLVGPAQKVIAAVARSVGKTVLLGDAGAVPSVDALAALAASGNPCVKPRPLYLKQADAVPAESAGLRAETP